jgi:hypothetical protein
MFLIYNKTDRKKCRVVRNVIGTVFDKDEEVEIHKGGVGRVFRKRKGVTRPAIRPQDLVKGS